MKRLSLFFAALMAATLSFAATKTLTLDFTSNTWGLPTDYATKNATFTDEVTGCSISFSGMTDSKGYKFNSYGGASTLLFGKVAGATLTFNSFDKLVTNVELIGASGGSGSVTWKFLVGTTELNSYTGCKETYSIPVPVAQQSTTNSYSIVLTNGNNAQFTKVIFTYEEASSEPNISCNDIKFGTVNVADENSQEVTVTGENLTDAIVATLQEGKAFTVTGTLTAEGGTLTVAVTAAEAGAYKDTLILTSGSVVKKAEITANVIKLVGNGTKESPYTVADVIALNNSQSEATWVKGYIVGTLNNKTNKIETPYINSMVAIADTKELTTDSIFIPVALPDGEIRTAVNLVDHAENLGLLLTINGKLVAYYGMPGVKEPTDYTLGGSTAIENLSTKVVVEKVVRNGQLVIIRGKKAYNMTGQVVE